MTTPSIKVLAQGDAHILGAVDLPVKDGFESVHVVAKLATKGGELTPDDARYYISPMIAQTAFEDFTKGNKIMPVFEGRTLSEMQQHLIKNAK